MSVVIKEVVTKKELKEFVSFLYKHYKDNKFWAPPLISDELKTFDREKSPVFEICRSKLWLAYKDNRCVGRVCGIIIQAWIREKGEKLARTDKIEFYDDPEVSANFSIRLKTGQKRKVWTVLWGQLGFSNLDQIGSSYRRS